MGQYHRICNVDRKEYLHPHAFGDGLKLMEFGPAGHGVMCGLAILLAGSIRGGERGGGDFRPRSDIAKVIAGRWAGDHVAIVGDYHVQGDVRDCDDDTLTSLWEEDGVWVDISEHVVAAMQDDKYVAEVLNGERERFSGGRAGRSRYDPKLDMFVNLVREEEGE